MSNKQIIEHKKQTFMFDGEYTKPIDTNTDIDIAKLKLSDIDFDVSHLVAKYLVEADRKTAEALYNELEYRL